MKGRGFVQRAQERRDLGVAFVRRRVSRERVELLEQLRIDLLFFGEFLFELSEGWLGQGLAPPPTRPSTGLEALA